MNKKKVVLIIITGLTLVFIWGQSAMGPDMSSSESGFVMNLVRPVLELFVGKGNVSHLLVRKLGHFSEYTIFGAELGFLFGLWKRKPGSVSFRMWPMIIAHGIICAFFDETIQIFSGRGPAIVDVWIDTAGVICGSGIILLIIFLREKIKNEK